MRNRAADNEKPRLIQLVAGRIGQEYNIKKYRKGAFWDDRYHATAIETSKHLQCCLVYLVLNMVRAGVVSHPEDWTYGGYQEIQEKRRHNTIVELNALADTLELSSVDSSRATHMHWVASALLEDDLQREEIWSQSLAVRSTELAQRAQLTLGIQGHNRKLTQSDGLCVLRDAEAARTGMWTPLPTI